MHIETQLHEDIHAWIDALNCDEEITQAILSQEDDNIVNYLGELAELLTTSLEAHYGSKLLYPELMKQYIHEHFKKELGECCDFRFDLTPDEWIKEAKEVEFIKTVPSPVQRTTEWYAYRNCRITASDIGSVFSKSPFTSRQELFRKKSDIHSHEKPFASNPHVEHGIKYEDAAIWVYEHFNEVKVHEYGCLPHKTVPFLGAPDGITDDGVMPRSSVLDSQDIWIATHLLLVSNPDSA